MASCANRDAGQRHSALPPTRNTTSRHVQLDRSLPESTEPGTEARPDDATGFDDAVARHGTGIVDRGRDHHGTSLPDRGWPIGAARPAAASAGTRANTMSKPSTTAAITSTHDDGANDEGFGRSWNRVIGSRRGHGNGDHSFESDAHFARRIEPERRDVDHRQPRSAGDRGRDHRHPGGGGSRPGAGQRPATHQCTLREQAANSVATGTVCSCVRTCTSDLPDETRPESRSKPGRNQVDSQLHPSQRIEQTFDAPGVER